MLEWKSVLWSDWELMEHPLEPLSGSGCTAGARSPGGLLSSTSRAARAVSTSARAAPRHVLPAIVNPKHGPAHLFAQ